VIYADETIVVDASLAAKWFLAEADSARALALLNCGARFAGPRLLKVEVAAAVTRRYRMGFLTREEARSKLAEAENAFTRSGFRLERDGALLGRASEIALDLRHALQDCLYVACAERLNARLMTADQTLLNRAAPTFAFVQAF
jgi:predicted nucleic acid-binding protein